PSCLLVSHMSLLPPCTPLFPYTPLFRSVAGLRVVGGGRRQADRGVELVDRAVGLDPRIVLAHAAAAEEAGVSLVSRSGVDAKRQDRKSTRLNSSHVKISYAVFCLKKKRR